jgi:hypothetical protein
MYFHCCSIQPSFTVLIATAAFDQHFLVICDNLYRSLREPNDTGNEFSALINNTSGCCMLCVQAEMSYITTISCDLLHITTFVTSLNYCYCYVPDGYRPTLCSSLWLKGSDYVK